MSTHQPEASTPQNGRNWPVLVGGLVILAAIVLVFLFTNPLAKAPEYAPVVEPETAVVLPESGPPLAVGDMPYEFVLQDTAGNPVALSEFIGRPVIVNYWATWCGPCRIEMPHLQAAFENGQDDGLVLLALNQDETTSEIDAFYDEFSLTFPALLCTTPSI